MLKQIKLLFQNLETQNIFSKTYNFVNDFEKILAPNQIEALRNTLKSYETNSGHKIIVATTSSIQPYTNIPEYTLGLNTYLANQLKLNATILVILSKRLRQIQVQGSEQISNKLNYDEIKSILYSTSIPEFKKGDCHKDLEETVTQIIKKLK